MFGNSYPVMEPAAVALFLGLGLHLLRNGGRRALLVLVSGAVYGLLLEEGDQLIFRSYHYSPDFILTIDRVPVTIALCWAVIIVTSMRITDAYGIPRRWAPFADALWSIVLDLSFDAIAIRLGFWTWHIGLDEGFLGVPAGNFYAWLMVAFWFSYFTRRWSPSAPAGRQLVVPFAAYAGLLVGMAPFIVLREAFFNQPGGGFPLFWGALAVFAGLTFWAIARRGFRPTEPYQPLFTFARLLLHAFFLVALFADGLYDETPGLIVMAAAMLAVELAAEAPLRLRRPSHVTSAAAAVAVRDPRPRRRAAEAP